MKKIVTMGEMMLRLMPPNHLKFEQASSFEVFYGGDEAIVASALAKYGMNTSYVTKLPENEFGDIAIANLRANNVGTEYIARGGKRIGLNFYENGVSVRPSKVVYDRTDSAFSESSEEDYDFEKIFYGAHWFHVSGITPALSEKTERITELAMKTARKNGVMISCDLNYRRKLWPPERAQEVMTRLMPYVDVCIGNEEDAEIMLGLKLENTDILRGHLDIDEYYRMFSKMKEQYGFKYIGTTLRESYSASDNGWSVLVYDGGDFCRSKKYNIHLLDRGGGGASFAAGFIYGIVNEMPLDKIAEFSGAASALKQTIIGDFNLASLKDVLNLCQGDTSGRVQR